MAMIWEWPYFRTPPPKTLPKKHQQHGHGNSAPFPGRDLAKFNQLLIKPIELPISPYKVGPQFVSEVGANNYNNNSVLLYDTQITIFR